MIKSEKKATIKTFQTHEKDTGSAQVQIAILTKKITDLTQHLQTHKKDVHSRRGLLGMVSKRRRLLRNLKMNNLEEYKKVVQSLNIRH